MGQYGTLRAPWLYPASGTPMGRVPGDDERNYEKKSYHWLLLLLHEHQFVYLYRWDKDKYYVTYASKGRSVNLIFAPSITIQNRQRTATSALAAIFLSHRSGKVNKEKVTTPVQPNSTSIFSFFWTQLLNSLNNTRIVLVFNCFSSEQSFASV